MSYSIKQIARAIRLLTYSFILTVGRYAFKPINAFSANAGRHLIFSTCYTKKVVTNRLNMFCLLLLKRSQ